MNIPLQFGIPGLDGLVATQNYAEKSQNDSASVRWTAAIVGPDGCGKSLLALHLASNYLSGHSVQPDVKPAAETESDPAIQPAVIYVSTDLSVDQARAQWRAFGLGSPDARVAAISEAYARKIPFVEMSGGEGTYGSDNSHGERPADIDLTEIKPSILNEKSRLSEVLTGPHKTLYFVDLQSQTAGDDWGFINRLVGLLPEQTTGRRHLVIVDAVEGLETFVGQRDAFGQDRDRRSRVAQLVRNAANSEAHLVFVVEEPVQDARLPEQFVTDLVLRVRQTESFGYTQRTIEVEKCRAIAHARGQHEIAIRSGSGSFTGNANHLDDPRILWRSDEQGSDEWRFLAHIHVIPSLFRRNRLVRDDVAPIPELLGKPSFGITQLDRAICKEEPTARPELNESLGSVTLLLGDAGTRKGRLGRAFLADGLLDRENGSKFDPNAGRVILITTRFLDSDLLKKRLFRHVKRRDSQPKVDEKGFVELKLAYCQRLNLRHLSSSAFLEILATYIKAAQAALPTGWQEDITERRKYSHQVRIVVEEWNEILEMYPGLRKDPLLFQSMLLLFKREGVKALVISTEDGRPDLGATHSPNLLREMDEHKILTWAVSFYGERRVAITVPNKVGEGPEPVVFELYPDEVDRNGSELLAVDPHFGLYAGVEVGLPEQIPLDVHLYVGAYKAMADDDRWSSYFTFSKNLLTEAFGDRANDKVLTIHGHEDYDKLRVIAGARSDSRLDHAALFQVDEYWRPNEASLADLTEFWQRIQVIDAKSVSVGGGGSGSFGVFEPSWHVNHDINLKVPTTPLEEREGARVAFPRAEAKTKDFYVSSKFGGSVARENKVIDRIPYTWDFGFLVADRDLWQRHSREVVSKIAKKVTVTVGDVWNTLANERDRIVIGDTGSPGGLKEVSWAKFLQACQIISQRENIATLDIDAMKPESLSCLILEMWASEQYELDRKNNGPCDPFDTAQRSSDRSKYSLRELMQQYKVSLYFALSRLVNTCSHLRAQRRQLFREHASPRFAASREWYHSAAVRFKERTHEDFCVLRLPGWFCVRGDWALAAPAGTRSTQLSLVAAELLSSRRMNLLRLQDGIGLPTRDVLPNAKIGELPTAIPGRKRDISRSEPISYEELCNLGAIQEDRDYRWIWRSQIRDYDRDSFYWRRWIARLIEEQHDWNAILSAPEVKTLWEGRHELEQKVASKSEKVWELMSKFTHRIDTISAALR